MNSCACSGAAGAIGGGGTRKGLGPHKPYNNWQANLIAALQMPENLKRTRAKKLKH